MYFTRAVFECNVCGNKYSSRYNLKKHEDIHNPCVYCSHVCLTYMEKKNHVKLHEVLSVYPPAFTFQDNKPSTSAATMKRKISSNQDHPCKVQRSEVGPFIQCEDCNMEIPSIKWFTHCMEKEHQNNVQKSIGGRVNLLRSKFRSRLETYRFPKGDDNLNIENYLEEGYNLLSKLLNKGLTEHIIIKFNLELTARYKLPANPLKPETDMFHITEMIRLSRADDIKTTLRSQIDSIKTKMSEFQERDSGWTLIKIKWMDININKASPISGSQHIPTPIELVNKKCCINVQNSDIFCFKWSILAAFYNGENRNLYKPSIYGISDISSSLITLECGRTLNFTGMKFPSDIKDMRLFEKNNDDISINVFGYDRKLKTTIGPYYITKTEKLVHINLMLLESECGGNFHYILIKNISR